MSGYIYIRNHKSYQEYNCYKVGKTLSIPDRDATYITGEIERGRYIRVIYIDSRVDLVEKIIKKYFSHYNVRYDGGTEFFKREINDQIIDFLEKTRVKYRVLSESELLALTRKKSPRLAEVVKKVIKLNKKKDSLSIRPYQEEIIQSGEKWLKEKRKGILVLPCGVGKTLISLWLALRLGCNKILVGVPNILLLDQWYSKAVVIFSGIPVYKKEQVTDKMKGDKYVVICTYQSIQNITGTFDMIIQDEVHHLTSIRFENSSDKKCWTRILVISCRYRLSLTATIKNIENKLDEPVDIISNDNIGIFGDIIERRSLLWAIEQNIVCDYYIQTIYSNRKELEGNILKYQDYGGDILECEKDLNCRLLLSAYTALKSIYDGNTHHILVYTNSQKNAEKVMYYIDKLLTESYFRFPSFFSSTYHSNLYPKTQKTILEKFEKASSSILSCVYCLGEGWDFPILDGVVFAENMSSNIRIVQSALRASRKNKNEPLKLTKIILPILDKEWMTDRKSQDYKKIREVIYQMGLEDTTISQKIQVYRMSIEKKTENNEKKLNEYDPGMTRDLQLRNISRRKMGISYDKAKAIIAEKSIKCKKEYYQLCERDDRLSEDPEEYYGDRFVDWIDYLSIKRKYYTLANCKKKIQEYLRKNIYLKQYYLNLSELANYLCKLDEMFPPLDLWIDYYNKRLEEIINLSYKKKTTTLLF